MRGFGRARLDDLGYEAEGDAGDGWGCCTGRDDYKAEGDAGDGWGVLRGQIRWDCEAEDAACGEWGKYGWDCETFRPISDTSPNESDMSDDEEDDRDSVS